jgi:RHS repeat-associated protein
MQIEALSYSSGIDLPNNLLYNGKELQPEYDLQWYDYGARFYDPELGRFHTLDAFAEKYFNFTPYQYGANNPVLYIDVNGDSIVYKNESTQKYVEQFTSKTRINNKGKEVKNRSYNKQFAQIIKKLDESSTVYEFNDSYLSSDPTEGGAVTTNGVEVFVGFNQPREEYGSKSNSLFEETYHAFQVENKTLEITESQNSPTGYGFKANGLEAEYQAKRFAANAPGTSLNFINSAGLRIETQMGLINRLSPQDGQRYLIQGYKRLYSGTGSNTYEVKYEPPYPQYNK